MRAPQVHRLDSIPRRRARYALNFLPFAGCDFPIDYGAARAVRNHQDRDRLDGKRDVMGEFS
jgi:hypothetical protein